MTHSLLPSRRTRAPLRWSGRYRALLAALAVMLLAVLPHVTFAASMMHGLAPRYAATTTAPTAMAHAHHDSEAISAPCHAPEGADRHGTPTSLKQPPCCIIGCGLLGFGPILAMPRIVASGHRLALPPARSGEGGEIEPAERPPRPALSRT